MDASTSPTISHPIDDKRKQSPPAFLDLADSVRARELITALNRLNDDLQAGRLGSNVSEVTAVRPVALDYG